MMNVGTLRRLSVGLSFIFLSISFAWATKQKVIVYNGNENFPPYEFINDVGQPDGFDVDLTMAVLDRLHLKYKIVMRPWADAMNDLKIGKTDLACLMYSEERAKIYTLGPTLKYTALYAVFDKQKHHIDSLSDFKNLRVLVERKTLSHEVVSNLGVKMHIFTTSSLSSGLKMLAANKFDVVLCESEVALYYIDKYKLSNLSINDVGIAPRELCFSGKDIELLHRIDNELYQMKRDGSYYDIYNKWFNHELKYGIIYLIIGILVATIIILYTLVYILRHRVFNVRRQLKDNNEQLRLALSAGSIIVWGFDVKRMRYFNIECDIFPPEGRTIEEEVTFFHPDEQEAYVDFILNAIKGRLPKGTVCFRIDYTKTNNWKYIEKEIAVLKDSDGKVSKIIGTHKDITERVETQAILKTQMEKAQEADRLKSVFLANMSHEIRTPLNAIVGFSNLLENEEDNDSRQAFINIINTNSDMLLTLINDILDFSRLEAGMMTLHYTTFNLSELFTSRYESLRKSAAEKNLDFICELPKEPAIIRCDYNRIAQVITNFLTNAIKYTEHGSVKMSYTSVHNGVKIAVEDTGIGIPKDKQAIVFQRFEKLGSLRNGTGLGLSICKAIIDLCHGSIGVNSEEGKGSTFWAWIPEDDMVMRK